MKIEYWHFCDANHGMLQIGAGIIVAVYHKASLILPCRPRNTFQRTFKSSVLLGEDESNLRSICSIAKRTYQWGSAYLQIHTWWLLPSQVWRKPCRRFWRGELLLSMCHSLFTLCLRWESSCGCFYTMLISHFCPVCGLGWHRVEQTVLLCLGSSSVRQQ